MAETFACQTKTLSFEQLAIARKQTQAVSEFLEKQLNNYLDILRSLFLPERVLGRIAGARFEVPGADKVLAELQENYRKLPGKPFDFPQEFEKEWLVEVGARLDLHRWEYTRELSAESGKRSILFTSPTRWILSYGPGHSVSQALQAFSRKQDRRGTDQLRQFVVNALVMQYLIARSSSLTALLSDLRYGLSLSPHPGLNGIPVVVIQSQINTFLPPEPLIIAATELSGVPAFIELIDADAVRQMSDPYKDRILALIDG
jgi:hypothetical protein